MNSVIKILHLPNNIAGNPYGLSQGEQHIGLDSQSLSIEKNPFNFPSHIHIPQNTFKILNLLKVFFQIRNQYDVFHFNVGTSLFTSQHFQLLELPFYKKNSVKVVTYQGCDARQKFPTMKRTSHNSSFSACAFKDCYDGVCNSGKRDLIRRTRIEKMMKHCEHAFAVNPDLLYFLPQEKSSFLPYTIPNFHSIQHKQQPFFKNDKIKILHAPTQRVTKGSEFIISAIEKLKEKYPQYIEFILVENLAHDKAMQLYQQADLIIDQILVGWYGGLAVEAMKMGIPVAAYINEQDLKFIPKEMSQDIPIINVNPNTIYEKLNQIILNRECLKEISKKSLDYVNQWHDPNKVAKITKNVYLRSLKA